jgi:hypothetical protein
MNPSWESYCTKEDVSDGIMLCAVQGGCVSLLPPATGPSPPGSNARHVMALARQGIHTVSLDSVLSIQDAGAPLSPSCKQLLRLLTLVLAIAMIAMCGVGAEG